MSRVVGGFPPRGRKMAEAEPLLEDLLDGLVREFRRGEDWVSDVFPKEMRVRLQTLAASHGFKVKTTVRGETITAQIIGEVEPDG